LQKLIALINEEILKKRKSKIFNSN